MNFQMNELHSISIYDMKGIVHAWKTSITL
jgi:hypothetical protein